MAVGAKPSNYRSVFYLLANLSVKVPDDDPGIMVWAAIVYTLQLRVEFVLVVIATSEVGTMHIINADVEEPI